MKKNILFVFLFTISFSYLFAQEKVYWETTQDINVNEFVNDFGPWGNTISLEVYKLKNDFTLYLRPVRSNDPEGDIIYSQIYLEKDNQLTLLDLQGDGMGDIGLDVSRFLFRFVIDFDDYFILGVYPDGSGNPANFFLINKNTGKEVLYYCSFNSPEDKINCDCSNNLLVYYDFNTMPQDNLYLLDLKNRKKYDLYKAIEKIKPENLNFYGYWASSLVIKHIKLNKIEMQVMLSEYVLDEKDNLLDTKDSLVSFSVLLNRGN